MNSPQLAANLEEIAFLLELEGENPFRCNAYRRAARVIEELAGELPSRLEAGTLTEVPGIGKAIAEKIAEFHAGGRIAELEELRARVPKGLVEMTRIPGLGPKKARALHGELGIDSVEALRQACESGAVAALKGFGRKTAENILAGIGQLSRFQGRHRLDRAMEEAARILALLRAQPAVIRAEATGSVRRWRETVGDLDFVVATDTPAAVMEFFAGMPGVEKVLGQGESKTSVLMGSGMQADLRCVTDRQFPYTVMHFTGSKEHNTRLRGLAKEKDLKLNEYGLFPAGSDEPLPADDEAEIHARLGLAYIPPELREDRGEVEAAQADALPAPLERADLRGILHMHTIYSDGRPRLEEYARWAAENRIEWMGITDHSRSLTVANGLSIERVLAQGEEIDAVNERFAPRGVRLLKGIESDILVDGALDYPDEVLARFDFVIASVHSRFNLPREEQTRRVCTALRNPFTTVLGHMTGRVLLQRDGYELDENEVIRTAAECGVAIEINCDPHRLDIDWRLVPFARECGVRFVLSPDAHVIEGLANIRFGIAMARKGWLTRDDILNCLSAVEFLEHCHRKRGGASGHG